MILLGNKLSQSKVYDLLIKANDLFVPALSSEVDLVQYSKKISDNAEQYYYYQDNEIKAFLFYYKNGKGVYISLICSFIKGIGSKLMRELFVRLQSLNIEVVRLEVDKSNAKALSFYNKHKFKLKKESGNKLILEKNLK